MLKPYLIENDGVGYKWLALQVDDFIEMMPEKYSDTQLLRFSYHNTSLKDGWNNINSTFVQNDSRGCLPTPDISLWLPGAALVLSAKAMNALGSVIGDFGEVLPINCDGEPFFIFNCLNMVEANHDHSEHLIDSGLVVGVKRIGFSAIDIAKSVVFKSHFDNCTALYCNDVLKKAVEQSGLLGIKFTPGLLPTTAS